MSDKSTPAILVTPAFVTYDVDSKPDDAQNPGFTRPLKIRCECADDLNFGEPQPDCHACRGTGMRPENKQPDGPIFNYEKKP